MILSGFEAGSDLMCKYALDVINQSMRCCNTDDARCSTVWFHPLICVRSVGALNEKQLILIEVLQERMSDMIDNMEKDPFYAPPKGGHLRIFGMLLSR